MGNLQLASAKFGWGPADIVLDFGVDLEPGERQILVEESEMGQPVHLDIVWRLHQEHCLIVISQDTGRSGQPTRHIVRDDRLFNGNPAHARVMNVKSLAITTPPGMSCRMNPKLDEFVVVSEVKNPRAQNPNRAESGPLGAVVMIFRATSFFTPNVVTITAGQRVVWIYADGAKEPHTTTSGACNGTDCTGGGKAFDSGKTLLQAGNRFEHTFKHPGIFPYHCNLHNASMVGTVIVKTKSTNGGSNE